MNAELPILKVRRLEELVPPEEDNVKVNIYLCRFCKQNFGRGSSKKVHENTCSFNREMKKSMLRTRFCCKNCGSNFNRKKHLIEHTTNDCGKIHECKKCNKIFGTLGSLLRHHRTDRCKNRQNAKKSVKEYHLVQ